MSEDQEYTPPKIKTSRAVKRLKDVTIKAKLIGYDNIPVEPEKVQKLSAMGCSQREIARFFGVDIHALQRNFEREIEVGREEMKQVLRRAMLKNAIENNVAQIQIFLAKNYLGMSDNPINTEDKKPLPWNSEDDND